MSESVQAGTRGDSGLSAAMYPASGESKTLTRDEPLKLYIELSANDQFRELYENNPKAALVEIGISESTLAAMSAICFLPSRLAPKEEFKKAYERINDEIARVGSSMAIPSLKLDGRQH